ncbi:MAG: helix-hairpin-helix domain-containing protein [Deltaproteobacteria bacterium]|nr:helix-hairpin-helix domain-containing protein [Deltaproteobacteria bacterium]
MVALARLFARVARGLARARQWPWTVMVLRATLAAFGILLLAWIGHTAAASGARPPLASLAPALSSSQASPMVSLFVDGGLPPPVPPPAATTGAPPTQAPMTAPPPAPPSSARASPESPVYINHASVDELRRLPGVGAKRAEAILALRQRLGRFHRVEDLLRVKGVGRTTLKRWRPLVRLDAPPPLPAPPTEGDAGT